MTLLAVRAAVAADLQGIVDLCRKIDADDWGLAAWSGWLSRPECLNLVAVAGERIVGCFHGRAVAAAQGFAQALRVDPARRRQGLGARLVDEMEGGLRAAGLESVRCTTGVGNRAARDLFAGRGWRQAVTISRRRHEAWKASRPGRSVAADTAVALAGRLGLVASRPAAAHFRRVYFEPSPSWLAVAAAAGRIAVEGETACALLDPPGRQGELWVTAIAGDRMRGLLERLGSGTAAVPLTVDLPDEPTLAALLDRLGFAPPGPEDRYVLLEQRL